MNITIDMLKQGVERIATACEQSQSMLCEADSLLGDGDLGITMQKRVATNCRRCTRLA